ncbi:MAG TPA: hypothetical protein VJA94_18020 [Candidatus Angelobacter sp.]
MRVRTKSGILGLIWLPLALLVCASAGDNTNDKGDLRLPTPSAHPEPSYKIQAGIDGEIYPFLANYASLQKQSDRKFGAISVAVSNPGDSLLRQRIAVKVLGWSDEEIQIAEVAPGATHIYLFAPTFLSRFYKNHEIAAATAQVTVTGIAGTKVYENTVPVRIRSSEDMYWGDKLKYAPFIASWVTPHDLRVESVLGRAAAYVPGHRLPGYEHWKSPEQQEQETRREARAIFTAVKRMGVSYVNSFSTLGSHQNVSERVRMPRVSLDQSSANCIDAAVMYASLFENLGMDATVVIVPGHAYAGVRVAQGSSRFLFIDVALTGRTTFEAAVASAERGLARYNASSVTHVLIQQARDAGIYPMP